MFSMCSELTPRARIPDTRIPQLMQPWRQETHLSRGVGAAGYLDLGHLYVFKQKVKAFVHLSTK